MPAPSSTWVPSGAVGLSVAALVLPLALRFFLRWRRFPVRLLPPRRPRLTFPVARGGPKFGLRLAKGKGKKYETVIYRVCTVNSTQGGDRRTQDCGHCQSIHRRQCRRCGGATPGASRRAFGPRRCEAPRAVSVIASPVAATACPAPEDPPSMPATRAQLRVTGLIANPKQQTNKQGENETTAHARRGGGERERSRPDRTTERKHPTTMTRTFRSRLLPLSRPRRAHVSGRQSQYVAPCVTRPFLRQANKCKANVIIEQTSQRKRTQTHTQTPMAPVRVQGGRFPTDESDGGSRSKGSSSASGGTITACSTMSHSRCAHLRDAHQKDANAGTRVERRAVLETKLTPVFRKRNVKHKKINKTHRLRLRAHSIT